MTSGRDPAFAASPSSEEWRPVVGYEDLYEVSSAGTVRSLRWNPPRVLRPANDPDGYPVVQLCRRGRTTVKLHRIVALAFHGDKQNDLHKEVAHLDGDRGNAAASNLKWVSHAENHGHRRAHGTWPSGERHPRAKLTEASVSEIRGSGLRYGKLAERYGVSWHTISDIKRGKRWSHAQ